jgi:hypothetical protein
MSRLLFLEYVLPERAYQGLASPNSPEGSRTGFPNPLERLYHVRKTYIRRGSLYALDTIFEMLFRGNELRKREGGKVKFIWQMTNKVDITLVLETPKKNMTLLMQDFH